MYWRKDTALSVFVDELEKDRPKTRPYHIIPERKGRPALTIDIPRGTGVLIKERRRYFASLGLDTATENAAVAFIAYFYRLFPSDTKQILPLFFDQLKNNPHRLNEAYFTILKGLLIDTAAVGFESVLLGLHGSTSIAAEKYGGLPIWDTRSLLALRIYLADGMKQSWDIKEPYLKKKKYRTRHHIRKMVAIAGTSPALQMGKDKTGKNRALPNLIRKKIWSYHRSDALGIFIPDFGLNQRLLTLGETLGRAPQASRSETFPIVKNMNLMWLQTQIIKNFDTFYLVFGNVESAYQLLYREIGYPLESAAD